MALTGVSRPVVESTAGITDAAFLVGWLAFSAATPASTDSVESGLALKQSQMLGKSGCGRVVEKAKLLLLAKQGLIGAGGLRRRREGGNIWM